MFGHPPEGVASNAGFQAFVGASAVPCSRFASVGALGLSLALNVCTQPFPLAAVLAEAPGTPLMATY